MKKILFLIHDLSMGGAEKVLVNLVNHMDQRRFDITVLSLFGGGINEQFLAPHIHYRTIWKKAIPGNSKMMKMLSPFQLHRLCIKEHYDVEVAYLEGPAARVISGCRDPRTKLIAWIHIEQHTRTCAAGSFRSFYESLACYKRFDQIVCVSNTVKQDFLSIYPEIQHCCVRYNTLETDKILSMKDETVDVNFSDNEMKLIAVGKIAKNKGFDRLARIVNRLRQDNIPVHLYALGVGPDQEKVEAYLKKNCLEQYYTFLGYQTNPYKYVAKCDLLVCASHAEGFSTATAEALIIGTPVCTVEVSGMKELLGEHDEWGMVVPNNDEALYEGIKRMLTENGVLAYYKDQAKQRGNSFSTDNTVKAVEELIEYVIENR